MKDIHRVYLRWYVACAPFLLVLLVGTILYWPPPTTASNEWFLAAFLSLIFGGLIFWKSDRIRHYNKVFAAHEENYRYEEDE